MSTLGANPISRGVRIKKTASVFAERCTHAEEGLPGEGLGDIGSGKLKK